MKINSAISMLIFFSVLLLTSSSCEKEDPVIPNEEEVITTLTYTLNPSNGGTPVIMSFQDIDGDGGEAPTIIGGTLAVGQTYIGTLELLNEQASPVGNITEEILEEAEEHRFFFQTTVPNLIIGITDLDANQHPLGLSSEIVTNDAGSGTLTIILRHEPDKTINDPDLAGGETDIEVSFDVSVL